jgi:hypothetical protein
VGIVGGISGLGCAGVGVDGTCGAGGSGDAHAITATIALNAWLFIGIGTFTSVVITANVFAHAISAFGVTLLAVALDMCAGTRRASGAHRVTSSRA